MWRRAKFNCRWISRWFSSETRRHLQDEGDWSYSSEWWGSDSDGHTVFRSISEMGNGVVSVVAHPSSKPDAVHWPLMEKWLQKRYAMIFPESEHNEKFSILGYQWRVLRFNEITRQSTVKIMAANRKSDPCSVFFMQQPHCLAVPYLKSMVSVGLATIAFCGYDLIDAVHGNKAMHILCIGHGGGNLPLFFASKIQGAIIHIVEIDPLVISASVQAMGFPAFSVIKPSGERAHSQPKSIDEVLWKGLHERLFLYESDAEKFILDATNVYDLVFIDAYDGNDIFPRKLWDSNGPFLQALRSRLHPEHGTVVVNLHSDGDVLNSTGNVPHTLQQILPMGKYVSQVCHAYKEVLVEGGGASTGKQAVGLSFTVPVPWLCNTSLVVCRGSGMKSVIPCSDLVLKGLASKSLEVQNVLNLPFPCLQYLRSGFLLVD